MGDIKCDNIKNENEDNITKSDFEKICRTCLKEKQNMTLVFNNMEVIRMLHTCTRIKIGLNDGLPSHICYECSYEVEKSYKFKQECEKSDRLLRRILKEYEDKQETIEETQDILECKSEKDNYVKKEECDEDSDKDNADLIEDNEDDDSWRNEDNTSSDIEMESQKDCTYKSSDSNRNSNVNKKQPLVFDSEKCDERTCTCKICNKVLVNIYSLARHMEMHNENRKFSHTCQVCNKGFYEKGPLTKHMLRHEGKTRYHCEICNKGFYELSAQAVHMKKHKIKPSPCDICGKKFMVRLQLEIHRKTHEELKHFCPTCGKGFQVMHLLKKHQQSHIKETPFTCQKCDGSFKNEITLRKHIKRIHEGIKDKDVCNVCGKSVYYLKYHMLRHYGGDRPYPCEECQLSFHLESHLTQHVLRKHRGEKRACTALCTTCGKECHSQSDLQIHMRKHTGERPHACHLCDKKYKTPSALVVHMRTHTNERPYVCSTCGKGFSTSTVLKKHVRIHTGERPYVCQLCERAFTQREALNTHMKIH